MATPPPLPRLLQSSLGQRVATSAVGVPLILGAIVAGDKAWAALVAVVLVAAFLEYARASGIGRRGAATLLSVAAIAALALTPLTQDIPREWPLTAYVLALAAISVGAEYVAVRRGDATVPFAAILREGTAGAFGVLYFGWLGSYVVGLRTGPEGLEWTLLAVVSVMAVDTGAYSVGRLVGQRRLSPHISPKKTVEGAVGGFGLGAVSVLLFNLLPDLDVPWWKMAILAAVLPVMAQVGDLAESGLKRALNVKDFSHVIPGHGGVADRLDSLLFALPTVYFFLQWIVR